jgi:phospholipid/cholesterol/gamma-HCH transport system permease protein
MIGGAIIAVGTDVSWTQYMLETRDAVDLVDFFCGFIKSIFFALLIGIAGCQAGLQCGRDSTAVGHATTRAVVRAIVYLIIADFAFNVLYDKMGI